MKKIFTKVIKPFLPKYEVICTNYQLIPGYPVNKNQMRHTFEKGASAEALAFYGKVIASDITKTMAPVEVHLKKRGRVIQRVQIGPVEELKKYKTVSVN
jgi:predicted lipoprotein